MHAPNIKIILIIYGKHVFNWIFNHMYPLSDYIPNFHSKHLSFTFEVDFKSFKSAFLHSTNTNFHYISKIQIKYK